GYSIKTTFHTRIWYNSTSGPLPLARGGLGWGPHVMAIAPTLSYKSRFFTFMDIYLRVRGLPVPSPWQGEG
ncbi:hypothetical protein, partial [Oscillatoria sp. HE19RPO]|uniref:hypothetical protein n=1 Tax=Oscillatoria sp. HE19RPO TaxID=2954806 RepID=UPI0020C33C07